MVGIDSGWPVVWAQATGARVSNPTLLAASALRRWCGSMTLCSPDSVPGPHGLWTWLLGLLALLLVVLVFQGPSRALAQVFDVVGHVRLGGSSYRRLKRAWRMLAATVGLMVVSWTGIQSLAYNRAEGREELAQLTKARGLGELAAEQGVLAALTPWRDVASLGSNMPLLCIATLLLFRVTAEQWGAFTPPGVRRKRIAAWSGPGCLAGGSYLLYRIISLPNGYVDLPMGGFLIVEGLVIPGLMAICDGLLLGWVLAELREAVDDRAEGNAFDTYRGTSLMPSTLFVCLTALPARYLATSAWLASAYLPSSAWGSAIGSYLRWQLHWGLADVQGALIPLAGLAGAAAWGGGGLGSTIRGYGRMLAKQGGRLLVLLAALGATAGLGSAIAYFGVLSMPAATWLLNAADSYAHYVTLPLGLWGLAALIELGEASLPEALLKPMNVVENVPEEEKAGEVPEPVMAGSPGAFGVEASEPGSLDRSGGGGL